jgi:hypothetical protein
MLFWLRCHIVDLALGGNLLSKAAQLLEVRLQP